MDQRNIKAGTTIYFGAPATPMPTELSAAIAALVATVPGILEAHLPQCFIEGDSASNQVLAILVSSPDEIPRICNHLGAGLKAIFPSGKFLDILPIPTAADMAEIRGTRCQIFPIAPKPWWKVW